MWFRFAIYKNAVLLTVLALSAAATGANIKIRYDAKTPQFAIFGTRVICVFYSKRFSELLGLRSENIILYFVLYILGKFCCGVSSES